VLALIAAACGGAKPAAIRARTSAGTAARAMRGCRIMARQCHAGHAVARVPLRETPHRPGVPRLRAGLVRNATAPRTRRGGVGCTAMDDPPCFDRVRVEALARELLGVAATASALPSERDQNWLLAVDGDPRLVFKIA